MIRFRPRKSFTIRGRPGAAVAAGPGRRWRGCGLSRAGRGGRRALAEAGRGGARQRAEPRRARAASAPGALPSWWQGRSGRSDCGFHPPRVRRGGVEDAARPRCHLPLQPATAVCAGPASGSSPSVPGSFRDLRPCPPPSGAVRSPWRCCAPRPGPPGPQRRLQPSPPCAQHAPPPGREEPALRPSPPPRVSGLIGQLASALPAPKIGHR